MADTPVTLSNVVQHDKDFLEAVYQALTTKSTFRQAGIIVPNADFAARANGAGKITSVPFWNPLAQTESKVPSDAAGTVGEVEGITQGELLTIINKRGNGWSSMDVVAELLADDPMMAIANRVAEYWAIDEKKMAISILKGILADDVATTDTMYVTATTVLNLDAIIDAAATLGDDYGKLDTLVIHKNVHTILQKAEANAFVPKSKTGLNFDMYGDYKLVIDSQMPVDTGVYTSALVGPGFFQLGEGSPKVAVEYDRSPRAGNFGGQDALINRRQFILHPAGMKQDGTAAGIAPTNTELAAAAMWSKGFDRQNVPVAFINSTLS